jgi:hypothetical protein
MQNLFEIFGQICVLLQYISLLHYDFNLLTIDLYFAQFQLGLAAVFARVGDVVQSLIVQYHIAAGHGALGVEVYRWLPLPRVVVAEPGSQGVSVIRAVRDVQVKTGKTEGRCNAKYRVILLHNLAPESVITSIQYFLVFH